jgi:hypothetical protein
MKPKPQFNTITPADWARAIPEARERRKGAKQRLAERFPCSDDATCAIPVHGVRQLGRATWHCAACNRDVSLAYLFLAEALNAK